MDHARQIDRHHDGQAADGDRDRAIARLARCQHGRVARRQLLALGLGASGARTGSSSGALIARGLRALLLIMADGAPGPIGAVEQCWPASTAGTAPFTACATCSPSCPSGSACLHGVAVRARPCRPPFDSQAAK